MTLTPRKLIQMAGALAALAVLAGCESGGGGNDQPVDTSRGSFDSQEFAVVDAEDAFENIDDATMDRDMAMHPVMDAGFRLRHHRHHDRPHLRMILWRLELTQEQREQVRQALRRHRRAIQGPLEELRAANQDLIDAANAERREIVRAARAGEITPEEAHRRLHEVSFRTRAAIRANPDNAPFLRAICDARRVLFEEIRDILDEAQRIEWDAWVAGLPGCR